MNSAARLIFKEGVKSAKIFLLTQSGNTLPILDGVAFRRRTPSGKPGLLHTRLLYIKLIEFNRCDSETWHQGCCTAQHQGNDSFGMCATQFLNAKIICVSCY